ncbi:unnamed protein product [Camellia sinensis]
MAQKDVSPNMRAILVDWLVKVAEEYELHSVARFFFNADRIYEKINHPPVDEFCYLTDNAYTKKEVVKMEADIFKHLKFEIPNLKLEFLGYYLAELSLLENDCVILLPSLVAVITQNVF